MIELQVPFVEKEEAKRLGARWNAAAKRWYVPSGVDPGLFARWMPLSQGQGESSEQAEFFASFDNPIIENTTSTTNKEAVSLTAFLHKIAAVVQRSFPGTAWISAEISELRDTRGHLYITLVEHDDKGNMVARVSARIWQTNVAAITAKFLQGAGAKLEPGIKILVCARVEFHSQYGMALFIEDIDPSYTLGDMAAKLAKIREILIAEKIMDLNKRLPRPIDFQKVAVISPQNAAGLGDFNREAEILSKYGLCNFVYFTAQFQGERAAADICRALEEARSMQAQQQDFDALVIIRGGGALSDLAWLNNEQLARAVCTFPIHVMVGVGHERDYTILDEIAGERFDTPSKVSQRIFNLITGNASEAATRYQEISQAAQSILKRFAERIGLIHDQIGVYAKQACVSLEKQLQALISEILSQSPQQILRKGFALVSGKDGKVITSKVVAAEAEILNLEFHDGKIDVRKF